MRSPIAVYGAQVLRCADAQNGSEVGVGCGCGLREWLMMATIGYIVDLNSPNPREYERRAIRRADLMVVSRR